jgi:hypothetical protein
MDWIDLGQVRDRKRVVVNEVKKHKAPKKFGTF